MRGLCVWCNINAMNRRQLSRFISKIDASSGCWRWLGATTEGYGNVTIDGEGLSAHRVAYEYFVGPIPKGLHIDHLCRNHSCVNPNHLEAVTPGENLHRGENFAAKWSERTHCKNGHPFTPENTYKHSSTGNARLCRECRRVEAYKSRVRNLKKKEILV